MMENISDRMPGRMSENYVSDRMRENTDRMPEYMSDRMPEYISDRMPEQMSDRMPE